MDHPWPALFSSEIQKLCSYSSQDSALKSPDDNRRYCSNKESELRRAECCLQRHQYPLARSKPQNQDPRETIHICPLLLVQTQDNWTRHSSISFKASRLGPLMIHCARFESRWCLSHPTLTHGSKTSRPKILLTRNPKVQHIYLQRSSVPACRAS